MSKRALLIASPYGELRGTLNDAKSMDNVLRKQGFEIIECYGEHATRAGILEAWQNLIAHTSPTDVVVVYYSGYGGLVQAPKQTINNDALGSTPQQHQFIVPMDYGETSPADFRGILDVEISSLLKNTTCKTQNVTVIIDCSHSGRMFRDERGREVRARNLSHVQYHDVVKDIDQFGIGQLSSTDNGEAFLLGNPQAVRIAASATTEAACEHITSRREWGGALTEALTRAIAETEGLDLSWRSTLLRVRQLVNARHYLQHPQVEGPDTRVRFSLIQTNTRALCLKVIDNEAILLAGSALGVRKGNVYAIVPFDTNEADNTAEKPIEATIKSVSAFEAEAEFNFMPRRKGIRHEGAFAFLKHEALPEELPVEVLDSLEGLQDSVRKSKYLRCWEPDEEFLPSIGFLHDQNLIALCNRQGIQIASHEIDSEHAVSDGFCDIVAHAEQIARAQRVRDLRCDQIQNRLNHNLALEIGTVVDGSPDAQFDLQECNNHLTEADSIYFKFSNDGKQTVYASLFNVNVTGHITCLTEAWPLGIEFPAGDSFLLGSNEFGELIGSEVSWPSGIPKDKSVQEEFMFILTSSPIDLSYLPESVNNDLSMHRDAPALISTAPTLYDIVHVPFTLNPLSTSEEEIMESVTAKFKNIINLEDETNDPVLATDIPSPKAVLESAHTARLPAALASKSLFGPIIRATKHIPPCVWVVNKHTEEITVVVSKYRPNRMLTGIGLNASATGAGLDISATTYQGPVTKKTLAAQGQEGGSTAVFPLWDRSEGFGVITIFKGPEKGLYIENDRVPLGATVHFVNKPDLEIYEYGAK